MTSKRPAFAVVMGAILLLPRLLLWIPSFSAPDRYLKSDGIAYWLLGQNMWRHFVYSMSTNPPWLTETKYLPVYPFFLGFFNVLLRFTIPWIIFVQILLNLAAVYAMWVWLRDHFRPEVALLGTLAFGLDLTTLFHVLLLSTENLFLIAATLAMIQTWRCLQNPDASVWIGSGLLWGVATMIRPIAMFFPPFLFLALLLTRRRAWLFILAAYLLPGLWCARNYVVTHRWMFTSQGGIDILLYTASDLEAVRTHQRMDMAQNQIIAHLDAQHPAGYASEMEKSDVYGREAARIILHHPILMAHHALTGILRILAGTGFEIPIQFWGRPAPYYGITTVTATSGAGTIGLWRLYHWLIPVQILYWLFLSALYIFFAKGILALWRSGREAEAILFLSGVLYFVLISSIHVGYYRFRIPVLPFLIGGAAGIPSLQDDKKYNFRA
jgi:hypothetical protein